MVPTPFDLPTLKVRLAALAERGIYVGTSSWKYEGWLGQVYTRERYMYRGNFAETRFKRECLREYAETFKTVCFDGAYYTFHTEKTLRGMADQVPADFRFAFKVTDAITVKRFPSLPKYGDQGGKLNENFLNPALFVERFLGPLSTIRQNVGPIMFEFSKFHSSEYASSADFLADLDRFFTALPNGWPFSVELRNRDWLGPAYLACLKKHGVGHVYNNWTDMPSVAEQIGIVGEPPAPAVIARFLLKPGRKYEDAVKRFEPYTHTQEVNEEGRAALAALIERGWLKPSRDGTFLYINNRLEGSALMTVLGVLERLKFLPAAIVPPPAPPPSLLPPNSSTPQLDLGF